ncbi:predicted protein [Pyrenophora tritici-repentis Pt-1C-BFP]|uniref:Uncharacterized protein n=1 Tax=Pyrenophora tritici-repentis (strain Pt-1C-BFP) TaxID=426418 RepID=B2WEQ6_PYRTR|nr:uncharacterized protein PTRG_08629 [Pyrenophora tritici-repentis Pt-1C-BFP]EDU51548.1 predicted protein [Pyrenophora tritici-repentis Pt-1C-BFP]
MASISTILEERCYIRLADRIPSKNVLILVVPEVCKFIDNVFNVELLLEDDE